MENTDRYKNDPVAFTGEILGMKLFEYQKTILRKAHEARSSGQQLIIHYPYRHGRTMMNQAWNAFLKTQ
jgi:hypothetical protein